VEALNKAYGTRGVSFYNVLSREPHPGFYGFDQPDSLEERKEYVRLADAELQMEIPWIIDVMDNTMQKTYGRMPNSEFIIASDGTLLESREWADPDKLKEFLEANIGPSEISEEAWEELGKQDHTMMAVGNNDEVPATEVPRSVLHDLEVVRLDKVGSIPFAFEASTLPPKVTAEGQSRLYMTITPDESKKVTFDKTEHIVVELSDVKGIVPIKTALKAGKRRKGEDVYPHTIGILWTLKDGAAQMAFNATVTALVKDGEAESRKVTANYHVSGDVPEPRVIMDEISPDKLPQSSMLVPLQALTTGKENVPMSLEAMVDPENKKIYLTLKVDKATGHKWNNLSAPPQVALKSVSGLVLEKNILNATKHSGDDDAEDRILVVGFSAESGTQEFAFEVTPEAWICNDDLGWCRIFAETYRITGKF
jgi:hypothetical protein